MPRRSAVSWFAGITQGDRPREELALFRRMRLAGCRVPAQRVRSTRGRSSVLPHALAATPRAVAGWILRRKMIKEAAAAAGFRLSTVDASSRTARQELAS
ncbi:pentatricopeptide repeat-containing protein [Panicum miliaceum]|uniref:Pentatricopeptide repeat-containing protein n=1 Tax=Panicum miliaceum TaxID=4540 RepID=A0A3L6QD25_PANMI|nr:pentatricopeptide repeat-containing protein [Panicum miliaceum]